MGRHSTGSLPEAPAGKWKTLGETADKGWQAVIKLCVILLVIQAPMDIVMAIYLFRA